MINLIVAWLGLVVGLVFLAMGQLDSSFQCLTLAYLLYLTYSVDSLRDDLINKDN